MTIEDFRGSLQADQSPEVGPALTALWWAAKGNWTRAHEMAQAIEGETGAWVHAYLHRVEGDADNAAYWYRRANQPVADDAPDDEWERIVLALLGSTA
jgi:hypothetical protein